MKKMEISKRSKILYILLMAIILIGDQLTKTIISSSMQVKGSQTIIDNFFYLTYAQNQGAAWSMLEGKVWLFIIVAFLAVLGMVYYFSRTSKEEKLTRLGLVMVFSGALGNLIDRISLGYVRDFLDFIVFGYDFPVFNIADMAVVLGIGLVILEVLLEEKLHGKNKIKNS